MSKVLITGVTGQDGSYMVDYLLKNTNCEIFGGVRRLSVKNHGNIEHAVGKPRFSLVDMDMSDPVSIMSTVEKIKPDYLINFAANSFVGSSWEMPINHFQVNTMGVLYQLEAIRKHCPECRYYNAGSSEEFGDVQYSPQNAEHPLRPRSPYGASKASARHIVKVYRDSYNLYAVQGWLFNHESERRGEEFVTRKITRNIARIKKELDFNGQAKPLRMGNTEARRDWSHAEDFVLGVWMMLNQKAPKDYVLSSGECHSVREFVDACFQKVDIIGTWEGSGEKTKFISNGRVLVEVDPKFYRPAEVELLQGDSSPARREMGWAPENTFEDLVSRMMKSDMKKV